MKKLFNFCLVSAGLFFLACPITAAAAEDPTVTVVYSLTDEEKQTQVKTLDVLLGEFAVQASFIRDNELTATDLAHSDKLIYLGVDQTTLSPTLTSLLNDYPEEIYAIGHNVEQLTRFDWLHFQGEAVSDTISSSTDTFQLPEKRIIYQTNPQDAQILYSASEQTHPEDTTPLIEQKNDDFYLAAELLEKPFDWFLADSLTDFLDCAPQKPMRYLRLEDVHPLVDPKVLQEQAEFLKEENIPYMVAVIPVYTTGDGQTVHLDDSPELVKTLQYMQANGASIVLHGYRHQYRQSETGEGFEFWDVENDRPILQASDEPVKLRSDFASDELYQDFLTTGQEFETTYTEAAIENGVEELVANGLYPLAFEAPHYTMSQNGYHIVAQHFSSYVGQLQLSDTTWESQYQPTYASNPNFLGGMTVYPETLGYVEDGDDSAIATIQTEVADYAPFDQKYLSAFYHPYLGIDQLKQLVATLEKTDATWFDLKEQPNQVTVDEITITSQQGAITVDKPRVASTYEQQVKLKKHLPELLVGFVALLLSVAIFF
ncbi:MAG: DUF2334 domain-containing protein [Enterococcus sp.]